VGFEDNVYFRKGELAHSNAQLVQRMADVARLLERPVASPSEARSILQLPALTRSINKMIRDFVRLNKE